MENVVAEKRCRGGLRRRVFARAMLSARSAALLGLRHGTPGVGGDHRRARRRSRRGRGISSTMVLVMGTSSCHMMNSRMEGDAPGIAGRWWRTGFSPATSATRPGQSSVGDAFRVGRENFGKSHADLNEEAAKLPPGSGGVMAIDWLNGCRTPLMDGRLSGRVRRAHAHHAAGADVPSHARGHRVRAQVDLQTRSQAAACRCERFVASGGLPAKSPLLMQIYADLARTTISRWPRAISRWRLGAADPRLPRRGGRPLPATPRDQHRHPGDGPPARRPAIYRPDLSRQTRLCEAV